jgi:predicted alpha/beta-fold hydrolase
LSSKYPNFKPAFGLGNRHIQTLAATFLGRLRPIKYNRETISLPDDDFVDLDWLNMPLPGSDKPVLIIFHGLEGSSYSHYVRELAHLANQEGWSVVVMNFRSCSGQLNKRARLYHSGETADATYIINRLHQNYPGAPLYAAGYSLGGNMLLKLAGEQGNETVLKALVSVSAPIQLNESTLYMQKGLSRYYQWYLLRALKRKAIAKFDQHDYSLLIDLPKHHLMECRDIRGFDELFTARIHGFDGASDYYQKNSAYQFLKTITRPTLLIHSQDDPIAPGSILPDADQLPSHIQLDITSHGGHAGFLGGQLWRPEFWLPGRILDYFKSTRSD